MATCLPCCSPAAPPAPPPTHTPQKKGPLVAGAENTSKWTTPTLRQLYAKFTESFLAWGGGGGGPRRVHTCCSLCTTPLPTPTLRRYYANTTPNVLEFLDFFGGHYATAYANTTPTLRQHYAKHVHTDMPWPLHYAVAYANTTPTLRQHYAAANARTGSKNMAK